MFIGRKEEIAELEKLYNSERHEFISETNISKTRLQPYTKQIKKKSIKPFDFQSFSRKSLAFFLPPLYSIENS